MKRGSRFILVLATSILTFGTLMATIGPKKFNKHFQHRNHCQHEMMCSHGDHCQSGHPDVGTAKAKDSI